MPSHIIRHDNDEWEFRFTRRRYGRQWFCWAELKVADDWISCGDPWPKVNPSKAELVAAATSILCSQETNNATV